MSFILSSITSRPAFMDHLFTVMSGNGYDMTMTRLVYFKSCDRNSHRFQFARNPRFVFSFVNYFVASFVSQLGVASLFTYSRSNFMFNVSTCLHRCPYYIWRYHFTTYTPPDKIGRHICRTNSNLMQMRHGNPYLPIGHISVLFVCFDPDFI